MQSAGSAERAAESTAHKGATYLPWKKSRSAHAPWRFVRDVWAWCQERVAAAGLQRTLDPKAPMVGVVNLEDSQEVIAALMGRLYIPVPSHALPRDPSGPWGVGSSWI